MSGLTRPHLKQVLAVGQPDRQVRFDGKQLYVKPEADADANNFGIVSGTFDASRGTLNLNLLNGATITIPGFLTVSDVGTGPEGPQGIKGVDGRDGLNGVDGEKGATGCQGPAGRQGIPGPRGEQGKVGPTGPMGVTGPTGPDGKDGVVSIFIQSADPLDTSPDFVVAGTLWVKPT